MSGETTTPPVQPAPPEPVPARPLPPPLGADTSILEDDPDAWRGTGDVLSAPMQAFLAENPPDAPVVDLDEPFADDGALDERPTRAQLPSSYPPEPASAIDTVDLEAPDLDDDEPAEPSSLVGEIPWHEDGGGPLRVAFAGGKGGAGRTLLAANVALFLARLGRSVVLADLDPAGSGLHTCLGVDPVVPAPGEELRGFGGTRIERVRGVPVRLCRPSRPTLLGPGDPLRADVLATASELEADVLILDLGTQADPLTLDAFLAAQLQVVVTLPERASIERSYGFLRAALDRRLLQGDDRPAVLARALITADDRGQLTSPSDLVTALAGVEPQAAEAIRVRLLSFSPGILMNRCRTRSERDLAAGMCLALRRRWGINPVAFSGIDNDDAVGEAARRQRPLVLEYPGATVVGQVERLARQVLARIGGREVRR
ncbi:MAG: hypothetical protein R3F60_24070 [bacterium]